MTAITLHSGIFTNAKIIAENVCTRSAYQLVSDKDIMDKTAETFGLNAETLERAVWGRPFVFNSFTHEKERAIAHLKTVLARHLRENPKSLYMGYLGHLIPKDINHILRVLTIADTRTRAQIAQSRGISEKEALKIIHSSDEPVFNWTQYLFRKEPWDSTLYDIVIPSGKFDVDAATGLILDNLDNAAVKRLPEADQKNDDFVLAADVELALAKKGHSAEVSADRGRVTITIHKKVILFSMLESELIRIAREVPGVTGAACRMANDLSDTGIYRKYDFDLSYNVLLVDDEREFVQTLSERLQMRDVGTHVVYDGKEALDFVDVEDLEVMVLDLKMPGIDGFEVLRQVKKSRPQIEVIILTGHGNEEDRRKCMELGAFAYLQKPADIDQLTQTMKDAYEKVKENRGR